LGGSSSHSGNETTVATNQSAAKIEKDSDDLGKKLPLWAILPFVGILLSIAIFPLVAPHFWHLHYSKVAAFWALLFAIPFLYFYHSAAMHKILDIFIVDYIPFIIMLWALFTIAGGIALTGNL
jgi:Na+/H+ antiporter NhaD/arsenite permease-like protein